MPAIDIFSNTEYTLNIPCNAPESESAQVVAMIDFNDNGIFDSTNDGTFTSGSEVSPVVNKS